MAGIDGRMIKSKKVGGFSDQVDEIPDVPANGGRRASFNASQIQEVVEHDGEEDEMPDSSNVPELSLNPKQNQLRTDLEMWVMDEIPELYGVGDSEELDESLQEDEQCMKITELILLEEQSDQENFLKAWLKDPPDEDDLDNFIDQVMAKVSRIQELGKKKKPARKK
mmetsp:Transcript_111031/g.353811  ORF Transcript_111031/g.353811 Transcript_111031/m.353811 type:complete len:167 (+) Transcript_111031:167-667(+)